MVETHDIPDTFEQETELFNWQGQTRPTEIAQRLRAIAGQLERGTVTLGDVTQTIPEWVAFKVELEQERTDEGAAGFELEVELIWPVRPIQA